MRRTGRPVIPAAVLSAAVIGQVFLLAGCGGAGGPADAQFRSRLDAACASVTTFDQSLPQVVRSKHLTADEAAARTNHEARTFRASVAGLTPPSGLSTADHTLVAELGRQQMISAASPAAAVNFTKLERYARTLLDDYATLGATGCSNDEKHVIATLQTAQQSAG